jgi:hypothetical protein
MIDATSALEAAIVDVDRLSRVLKKDKGRVQVRSSDERASAKATAQTWFRNHRPLVATLVSEQDLGPADTGYRSILEAAEHAGSRSKYFSTLKTLRACIVKLRSDCIVRPMPAPTADKPPSFAPLVSDAEMQIILTARWNECIVCLAAGAPLAATVMMGGFLEAILLARINHEKNRASIFKTKSAPKDRQGATKSLKEWMLNDYIQVVHELGWVSVSAKDIGEVLRDYRNYIHPYKQLSHGVHLSPDDAILLWEVTKNITRQVLGSI